MSIKIEGAQALADRIDRWDASVRKRLKAELNTIGEAWLAEYKRRIPVDTGQARNTANKRVSVFTKGQFSGGGGRSSGSGFELSVGNSSKHAIFIEFGTEHIAGGRVKALGTGPVITDSQAITSWPALAERGGSGQQMPALRPAWAAIKQRALQRLADAIKPPA